MKKLLTLLIASSLALTAHLQAQQPEESPAATKKHQGKDHSAQEHAVQAKPLTEGKGAAEAHASKERAAVEKPAQQAQSENEAQTAKEAKHAAKPVPTGKKHGEGKTPATTEGTSHTSSKTDESTVANPTPSAVSAEQKQGGKHKKNQKTGAEATTAKKTASPTASSETASSPAAATKEQSPKVHANAKKPDVQTIQKVKTEHASFKAQPKPEKVPPVTFTENRRIENSDQWQGERYQVYRSYHPERHDAGYYHSHYKRVELISGGYYYWNNGYWYPAWGYNTSHEYYPYDAPIYVGHRAEPLDRVIANVQALLQDQGYYKGEVDGLLGPLTREALVGYQNDNGLYRTAVIDEPTLDSLGLE